MVCLPHTPPRVAFLKALSLVPYCLSYTPPHSAPSFHHCPYTITLRWWHTTLFLFLSLWFWYTNLSLAKFSVSFMDVCQPPAVWALICRTHQHYRRQWLPNTELSNSRRWVWARADEGIDGYGGKYFKKSKVLRREWKSANEATQGLPWRPI